MFLKSPYRFTHSGEPRQSARWLQPVAVSLFVAAGAATSLLGSHLGETREAALALAAGAIGLIAVALGVLRIDMFLLALVVGRASIDSLHGGPVPASVILGGATSLVIVIRLAALARARALISPSGLTRSLYAFAGAAVASAAFSDQPMTCLAESLRLVGGALIFGLLEQELRDNWALTRRVLNAVLISLMLPSAGAIYQLVAGIGNADTFGFNRVTGTFVHPTPFSTYLLFVLALLLPRALAPSKTPFGTRALLAGTMFLLMATYTRSSWLAFLCGAMFVILKLRVRLLVPAAILVACAALLLPGVTARFDDISNLESVGADGVPANSLAWRVGYWQQIVETQSGNALLGSGFGRTAISTVEGLDPHNIYVQTFAEMGIIGSISLAAVFLSYAKQARTAMRRAVTDQQRSLSISMAAIGIMLAVQGLASNVLSQNVLFLYAAAACGYGYIGSGSSSRTTHSRRGGQSSSSFAVSGIAEGR